MNKETIRDCSALALLTIILVTMLYPGMQATDDLGYALKASAILKNGFALPGTSHQIGRIGTYIPLALSFKLFGISQFSLALIPVLCSTLTTIFIYFIARKLYGAATARLSALLFAFFPLTLFLGSFFVPEPMLCAFTSGAALLFLKSERGGARYCNLQKYATGTLVGLGYLTTEASAVMLVVLFIYKLLRRRLSLSDLLFPVGFITVVCGELLYHKGVYGHFFYRFTHLGGTYTSDPMLVGANAELAYRLLKSYLSFFIYPQNGLGLYGYLLLLGVAGSLLLFRKNVFLFVWAFSFLAFYNFMSVSIHHYIVLPPALRLIYPACIPMIILTAELIRVMSAAGGGIKTKAALATLVAAVVTISTVLVYLNRNSGFTAKIGRSAEAVAGFIKSDRPESVVSDERTLQALSFYLGFSDSLRLITFKEYAALPATAQPANGKRKIVINGLIFGIPPGEGGFFPYDKVTKAIMDQLISEAKNVEYYQKFTIDGAQGSLLSNELVRLLYGQGRYAEMLLRNRDAWVKVLR
ncbi:MAG: glycosyltransferase family 39 protein [Geobacteraceae bacterium]|nr:glycosyltransferase family 39 protein [Geobacteraceae bacterium]